MYRNIKSYYLVVVKVKIMKYVSLLILGFFTTLLMSGCGGKQLTPEYALKSTGEGVFVMGVNSHDYKLLMWEGRIRKGYFVLDDIVKNAVYFDRAKNGYAVSEVGANQYVGFKSLVLVDDDDKIVVNHKFCNGKKTPVFYVPKGSVVYAGDINIKNSDGKITSYITYNLAKAKAYINRHYPNLKGKLQQVIVQKIPSAKPCHEVRHVYTPIYIYK
jgi:hypothetical protein